MSALNYAFQNDAFQLDAFEADIALEPGISGPRTGIETQMRRYIRYKDPSQASVSKEKLFEKYRKLGGR